MIIKLTRGNGQKMLVNTKKITKIIQHDERHTRIVFSGVENYEMEEFAKETIEEIYKMIDKDIKIEKEVQKPKK